MGTPFLGTPFLPPLILPPSFLPPLILPPPFFHHHFFGRSVSDRVPKKLDTLFSGDTTFGHLPGSGVQTPDPRGTPKRGSK